MMTTYSISDTSGLSGGRWDVQYNSRDLAAESLRLAMGWSTVVLSAAFTTVDGDGLEHTAWCAYETQEECDADEDGAYAPRIENEA